MRTPLSELEKEARALLFRQYAFSVGLQRLKLAIIGNFDCGKSYFVNSIIGEEVCPVSACPTTSSITRFTYGEYPRVVLHEGQAADEDWVDRSGREIPAAEYHDLVTHSRSDATNTARYRFDYYHPFDGLRHLEIFDTPGFANPENEYDTKVTLHFMEQADVFFFLSDLNRGELTAEELRSIRSIRKESPEAPCYLVLTKADTMNSSGVKKIGDNAARKYGSLFTDHFAYSSKAALQDDLERLGKQLSAATDGFMAAVRRGEPGKLSIESKKDRLGGLSVSLDDQKIYHLTKRSRGQGLAGRDHVLTILKDLGQARGRYIEAGLARAARSYERTKGSAFSKLLRQLDAEVADRRRGAGGKARKVAAAFDRLDNEALEALEAMALEPGQIYYATAVSKKEKSYVFSSYWKLLLRTGAKKAFAASRAWEELDDAVKRTLDSLEDDIDVAGMRRGYKQVLDGAKAETSAAFLDAALDALQSRSLDYFDDKEEAENYMALLEFGPESFAGPLQSFLAALRTRAMTACGFSQGQQVEQAKAFEVTREKIRAHLGEIG